MSSNDFFTIDSLLTFTGSTLAIVVVTNTVRALTQRNWLAVPAVVALSLALGVAFAQGALGGIVGWVVALVNACLLFCTALGMQVAIVSFPRPKARYAAQMTQRAAGEAALKPRPIRFFGSWLDRTQTDA